MQQRATGQSMLQAAVPGHILRRGILRNQLIRRCHVTLALNIHACLNPTTKAAIATTSDLVTTTTAPIATTVATVAEQAAACMQIHVLGE
jgi:hypothetical protein